MFLFKSSLSLPFLLLASILLVQPLFKPPFQVKAVIVVKTNSIMIDRTDLKSMTDRIDTNGKRDMDDSMTGPTSNSFNKRLTKINPGLTSLPHRCSFGSSRNLSSLERLRDRTIAHHAILGKIAWWAKRVSARKAKGQTVISFRGRRVYSEIFGGSM